MKSNNSALIAAAGVVASFCAVPAIADDTAYENSFRLGSETVFYHTKADDLSGPYVPAGVNLKAKDLETLYIAYVRHIWSGFQAEFALGYPPLSKVEGRGPATLGSVPYNGQIVSTARWLSPTLFLEYQFLSENSWFQPFIGAGVNYTTFYDRNSTAQGNAASGGPTRLSLTSSVGPAATAGIGFNFSPHWHLYTSYSIARVNSDLRAETAGVIRTTHIRFGPQVLIVSAGYSF
jgi:outer membrane protein